MANPGKSARMKGILAPVVTPFASDFEVDVDRFIAHCNWLVGDVGLAIFGTNSEAASISADERLRVTDRLLAAGVPAQRMMPGTGACSITEAATLTRHAVQNGVAGVLMLPPFYFKGVSEDGLFGYYSEVIQRVGDERLAVYVYHIPQLTQTPITLSLIERLLKHYPDTVAGAKDSSGDWNNSKAMIEAFGAEGFDVFPASESMLTRGLAIGAAGCISATANVNPRGINALYRASDAETRRARQSEADAVREIFQKTAMIPAMKAVIAHFAKDQDWARVRPPLTSMSAPDQYALLTQLSAVGFEMPGLSKKSM